VILEGVDVDGHAIVEVDLLSRRHPGVDLGGIVFADPADVQVLAVVGEIGGGGLRDGFALMRIELLENRDHSLGFARRPVQKIRQRGRTDDPRYAQRHEFHASTQHRKRCGGNQQSSASPQKAETPWREKAYPQGQPRTVQFELAVDESKS